MRPKLPVAALLLLAAFTAVGCSKRDKPQSRDSAQTKPTATSADASTVNQADEEGAIPETSKSGPVSFADGEAAYHAKSYGDAARIFEQYTAQRPENAWGHFMLGLSAWKSGDLGRAEKAFDAALALDPDHVKSLVNLSRVLIEQKRFDDALDKLARASDIEPDSNEVSRLQGRAYHAKGKTEDAVAAYRRAIEGDATDAWSMNNLGLLLLEERRPDEALPLLAKAVELRKEVPAFHNNLGMALEHTGRFRAAATAYSGALTADPAYGKAQQNLARVDAVKKGEEEPFELETAAKGPEETTKISDDASVAK